MKIAAAILAVMSLATTAVASTIEVTIREPVSGQPALGSVEVVASVLAVAAIERVEVMLDGRLAEGLSTPPYQLLLDIGTDNRRHVIEVVAYDVHGDTARATVTTEPIPDSGRFALSLQQLYITALEDEARVLDLSQHEFSIYDEGDRQEVVSFARGDIPFTAALLIDASSSMTGARLTAATAGVRQFIERAGELDQVCLLAFSDRVLGRTAFSNDVAVFDEALDQIDARGGTAIYDHLYMAVKLLEQRQGRRVAVLLSDGVDSHSAIEIDHVLRKVRHSQTLLYWIWLTRQSSLEFEDGKLRNIYSTWHTTDEYQRQFELLREAVAASGGRIVPVSDVAQIEPVFIDILKELREQYVFGYYPSDERNDGSWHEIKVKVGRAGVKVRTHEGYVDF